MAIFTKMTEAEARKAAKTRVDEILHPQCEIKNFNFPEHLSDNQDLVPSILEYVRRGSANICLSAPCASGKTYMIVNKLTKAAHEIGRRVIMTSPLSMLNTQTFAAAVKAYPVNEAEDGGISCEILSGSSRDTYAYATFTSCVYDSIYRLKDLDDVELRKTILVIDESHQLPYSRNYRKKAVSGVEDFANHVIDAGGTVIYMTATPRMNRSKSFNAIFTCTKVDENGNPVSPCLMKEFVYSRRVANRGSNIEILAAHVYEDFIKNKTRSIILLQSKQKIRQLQHILTGLGLSVGVLRSDDKEYEINMATHEKEYRSKLYGELAEHATLIYKDVYLVTSVIEVGVSIEHVMNAKGEPEQPENMAMVYVCLNTDSYDLDAMNQFFSRLRFPYKKAILFGKSVAKQKMHGIITPESYFLREEYKKAFEKCKFFNCTDEPRAAVRTADGRREDEGLKKEYTPDGRLAFSLDDEEIMLTAYHKYDLQAYYTMPDKACEFLQQIFGVPVKKEIWKPSKLIRSAHYRPEPVSEKVVAELKIAINDPSFRKAVADPQGITENPHIDKIKVMGGNDVLHFLSVFVRANCFSHENEVVYAVAKVEDPRFTITDKKGREVDPETVARHNGFRMLANSAFPERTLDHLTKAYHGDLKITLTTTEQQILSLISGTKSWQYFLDLMESYSNTDECIATAYDFKEMCMGFASMKEDEAFEYRLREQCAFFNVIYDSTSFADDYISAKRYSLAGREYFVIRNAGNGTLKFDFTDKEGKPLFPGGITNKTVTIETLRLMAKQMATLIRQNFDKGMMPRRYSAKQIRALLFGVYCVTKSSGKSLDEAFVVRNVRKRASCYGLPGYIFSYDDVGADDPQTMDDEHICDKITKIVHCDEKDIPKATSAIKRLMNQIAPTDADRRFGLTKYFTLALTENRNLPKEERLGVERDDIMDILKTSATVLSEILYEWTVDLMVLDFSIDRLYLKKHPKRVVNG